MFALTLSTMYIFPGANIPLGIVICGIFFLFMTVTYSGLLSAFPRSGGDYTIQSRMLHPGLGYAVVMTFLVINIFWWAVCGWSIAVMGISPVLYVLGLIINNPSLIEAGIWTSGTDGVFVISFISCLWGFAINTLGMKWYGRLQKAVFYIGVAALVIMGLIFATTTRSTFIQRYNEFSVMAGLPANAYQDVINTARDAGITWGTFSWPMTLMFTSTAAYYLWCAAYSAFICGEIKEAHSLKRQMYSTFGAELFGIVATALLFGIILNTAGTEFVSSAGALYYAGKYPLPVPPFFGLFAMAISPNIYVALLTLILFNAWYWMWFLNGIPCNSRVSFAMAFDRVLHSFFASMWRGRPVKNIAFWVGLAIFFVGLWRVSPVVTSFFYDTIFVSIVMVLVTIIAGIIFPFKERELYSRSPISKWTISGVPIITICGILAAGYFTYLLYIYATVNALGVNSIPSAIFLLAIAVVSLLMFYGFKWYRKKQGIDIDLIYKEIPPE